MTFALLCLLTFAAMCITEVCWVACVTETQAQHATGAGLWALALFVTTGITTICYTTDPWLLIPAALGAFAGTYFGVWWNKQLAGGKATVLSLLSFYGGH